MTTPFTGSCLCGHVSLQGSVEKPTTALCHCKNCQRHSGAAFSVNLIVSMSSLSLDKSRLTRYQDKADSGNTIYRYSCNQCHSVIISGNENLDGIGFLKTGVLDDTSFVQPTLSVWECSAQSWVPSLESMAHFDKNPPM